MASYPRMIIARHGETVFNAAGRLQGKTPHTPLTRTGFAQADEMGAALRTILGEKPPVRLWASPTGRALQTLAVIAEHLALDWHEAETDERLSEIDVGAWGGLYRHRLAEQFQLERDAATGLITTPPPEGETYRQVADRLSLWLAEREGEAGTLLIVMHGMSSRVLRALLAGSDVMTPCGAPVSPGLPQGSVVGIQDGVERVIHRGSGRRPA